MTLQEQADVVAHWCAWCLSDCPPLRASTARQIGKGGITRQLSVEYGETQDVMLADVAASFAERIAEGKYTLIGLMPKPNGVECDMSRKSVSPVRVRAIRQFAFFPVPQMVTRFDVIVGGE